MSTTQIATEIDTKAKQGIPHCPNGHFSSVPPQSPLLLYCPCAKHYLTELSWNEYCVTCGVHHALYVLMWRKYPSSHCFSHKNFCGQCGARMVTH